MSIQYWVFKSQVSIWLVSAMSDFGCTVYIKPTCNIKVMGYREMPDVCMIIHQIVPWHTVMWHNNKMLRCVL